MQKKITLTGANIVFLVFAVAFLAYQVAATIIFGADVFNNNIYLVLLINELVLILGPVLIYAAIKKVNIRETFRLNKPGLAPVIFIILISVPAYFVAAMLNNTLAYFLQFIGKIPAEPIPVPQNVGDLLLGLLMVAVLPGICEETLHRVLLLRAYEKRGSYKAVVITAVFFGLFHFDITNLLGPVFLGLIIAYYVVRTNSVFAGMLAHFLNNAIAELWQYLDRNTPQTAYITIAPDELASLLIYGFIGLIFVCALLYGFKRFTEGRSVIIPPISTAGRDFISVFSHWPIIIIVVLYLLMQLLYILSIVMLKFTGQ